MALCGPRRLSLRLPAWLSREKRGRLMNSASGTRRRMRLRMVAAPRNIVSWVPRARSSRSVKTWPRSGSAASCISSTATNAALWSSGINSTVHTK